MMLERSTRSSRNSLCRTGTIWLVTRLYGHGDDGDATVSDGDPIKPEALEVWKNRSNLHR